jgi:methionyl-tRNA synthetase
MKRQFISTAIPYVNASPHIGFALELILADVVCRHRRQRGETFFLSGTDDNSLKNALAAERAAVTTEQLVATYTKEFHQLRDVLNITYDDFLSTSTDPRHAPAVRKLWERCRQNGDIFEGRYDGLYCVACEQFCTPEELQDGVCPEHGTAPERVAERNYFFRLSRYQDELFGLIDRDELAIRPAQKKNEVLAFLSRPLRDLSVSRSSQRARGWGIPVPDDESQIVYVWFDALANYISALGYAATSRAFRTFWTDADSITHVIGKGVTRFHAVYWPAILLSAGLRPPTEILVHGYVTVEGKKISKSTGNTVSPTEAERRHGADALRYYLLRHIGSQRDGDFSWSRFDAVYEHDLANDLGNLVSRTVALGGRYGPPASTSCTLAPDLAEIVASHVESFELDRALDAIWRVVSATNAYVNESEPWTLVKQQNECAFREVLGELYGTLTAIGEVLRPFLPETSERLLCALASSSQVTLFPKKGSTTAPTIRHIGHAAP